MEPIATMGVLVGATRSIKIGTAVLIIPYRNPVLLSRMLITMDQFSEGRIILGAGVGWLQEEFQVMKTYDFEQNVQFRDPKRTIFDPKRTILKTYDPSQNVRQMYKNVRFLYENVRCVKRTIFRSVWTKMYENVRFKFENVRFD